MTPSKPRPFQFSLSVLLAFVAVCALALGGWRWWHDKTVGSRQDSYAAVQIAAMVNAYLEANEGTWPGSWDDLQPFYRVNGSVTGHDRCSFEEVRDSWGIDFHADPVELARAKPNPKGPPFRAIYQRHRRPLDFPEWEPNVRIHVRLRGLAGLQVAAMVIEYMKANGGAWPGNWEDLRRHYPSAVRPQGGHWCSFELARGCMEVDFNADPAELARAEFHWSKLPFRVVYPQQGKAYPGGWDPNRKIYEYLTSSPPDTEPQSLVAPETPVTPCELSEQYSYSPWHDRRSRLYRSDAAIT